MNGARLAKTDSATEATGFIPISIMTQYQSDGFKFVRKINKSMLNGQVKKPSFDTTNLESSSNIFESSPSNISPLATRMQTSEGYEAPARVTGIRFSYDGVDVLDTKRPFTMDGGDSKDVVSVPYLSSPGLKTIKVEPYVNGKPDIVFDIVFTISSKDAETFIPTQSPIISKPTTPIPPVFMPVTPIPPVFMPTTPIPPVFMPVRPPFVIGRNSTRGPQMPVNQQPIQSPSSITNEIPILLPPVPGPSFTRSPTTLQDSPIAPFPLPFPGNPTFNTPVIAKRPVEERLSPEARPPFFSNPVFNGEVTSPSIGIPSMELDDRVVDDTYYDDGVYYDDDNAVPIGSPVLLIPTVVAPIPSGQPQLITKAPRAKRPVFIRMTRSPDYERPVRTLRPVTSKPSRVPITSRPQQPKWTRKPIYTKNMFDFYFVNTIDQTPIMNNVGNIKQNNVYYQSDLGTELTIHGAAPKHVTGIKFSYDNTEVYDTKRPFSIDGSDTRTYGSVPYLSRPGLKTIQIEIYVNGISTETFDMTFTLLTIPPPTGSPVLSTIPAPSINTLIPPIFLPAPSIDTLIPPIFQPVQTPSLNDVPSLAQDDRYDDVDDLNDDDTVPTDTDDNDIVTKAPRTNKPIWNRAPITQRPTRVRRTTKPVYSKNVFGFYFVNTRTLTPMKNIGIIEQNMIYYQSEIGMELTIYGPTGGLVTGIKYSYDNKVVYDTKRPYSLDGSKIYKTVPYLSTPGTKTINIEIYTNGISTEKFTMTFTILTSPPDDSQSVMKTDSI